MSKRWSDKNANPFDDVRRFAKSDAAPSAQEIRDDWQRALRRAAAIQSPAAHSLAPNPQGLAHALIRLALHAARIRRGLSQEGLADRCGIAASAISHYETGRRRPNLQNLVKLADGLGVSVDYLLGRTVNDKSHLGDVDSGLEKVRV